MSKLGNFWKTVLAGGAGVAALAAVNAAIRRQASEPDDSALGGEARFFDWKYGRVFYKSAGLNHPGPPLVFIHGVGAGASSFMWRKNFDVNAGSSAGLGGPSAVPEPSSTALLMLVVSGLFGLRSRRPQSI